MHEWLTVEAEVARLAAEQGPDWCALAACAEIHAYTCASADPQLGTAVGVVCIGWPELLPRRQDGPQPEPTATMELHTPISPGAYDHTARTRASIAAILAADTALARLRPTRADVFTGDPYVYAVGIGRQTTEDDEDLWLRFVRLHCLHGRRWSGAHLRLVANPDEDRWYVRARELAALAPVDEG